MGQLPRGGHFKQELQLQNMGPVTEGGGGGGIGIYKKPQNRRQNHSKPQKNWIQTENRMQTHLKREISHPSYSKL